MKKFVVATIATAIVCVVGYALTMVTPVPVAIEQVSVSYLDE